MQGAEKRREQESREGKQRGKEDIERINKRGGREKHNLTEVSAKQAEKRESDRRQNKQRSGKVEREIRKTC